jgi:predicted O-methyltransferase YrrM
MEITGQNGTKLILEKIHSTNKVQNSDGMEYDLHSNIDKVEGQFLEKLILSNEFSNTIEIGCAYGISSLYICGALKIDSFHTIIDPFQSSEWKNVGIDQLRKAGVNNFKLIENNSEFVLPALLEEGAKFDFAFIDGWHTFDHTLLDIFYLNRMLKVGGVMVIDDVGMRGVEKAINYFVNYPAYEFIDGIKLKNTRSRNFFRDYVITPLNFLSKSLPSKVRQEVFSSSIINHRITGYSMVALRKIKEDERPWNWYKDF